MAPALITPPPATAPNFDRVARIYRWAEYLALGPLLERVRTHFLPQLPPRRFALALGDGDGRFLAELLAHDPGLRAHAVDGSTRMLELLSARCHFAHERLTVQHAPLHDFTTPTPPDLIVSHFVLDCFDPPALEALCAHVTAASAPGALWLVSDFGIPQSTLLRPFAALYIRTLYAAFRVLTRLAVRQLPDHETPLRAHGWQRQARRQWLGGFLYTELWQRQTVEGRAVERRV